VSRAQCAGICKDGSPCRNSPLPGFELCWRHDPKRPRIVRRSDPRTRQCPECSVVRPPREFKTVGSDAVMSYSQLRCPVCGRVGPRVTFPLVGSPGDEANMDKG
jgi:hypothetical protein